MEETETTYQVGDRVVVWAGDGTVKRLATILEAGRDGYGVDEYYRARFDGTHERVDPWGYLFYPEEIISKVEDKKPEPSAREKAMKTRLREIEKLVAYRDEVDMYDDDYERGLIRGRNELVDGIRAILHGPTTQQKGSK